MVVKENEIEEEWQLDELVDEAKNYIRDAVLRLLLKEPARIDHLNILKEACLDDQFYNIDIFTLNHDTVLEKCLSQNTVQFTDGFGEPQNDVRYWDPNLFENSSSRVRLFKLHGSINWFRFRSEDGDSKRSIGIPNDRDFWHTKDLQGQLQWPEDKRPMLLVGTFNKMFDYLTSIFVDLYCQFHHSLCKIDQLIVCGYGFGDKGINNRIFEWVNSSLNHRFIIIHPDSEKLCEQTRRGILRNNWNILVSQNKLISIPKKIENTSWQEIKECLLK